MPANQRISELTAAGALAGADIAPVVQSSSTVRTTLAALLAFFRAGTVPITPAEVTGTAVITSDSRLSDARTPTAHATSHKSGGSDPIKLDELAAPTDVTTLDVSTSLHGLIPKQPSVATIQHFSNSGWVPAQELLSAARTYYVRTDGNDSNTGLADTAGGAFLTIQKAIDVSVAINLGTFDITIQVRAGTFAPITLKFFQAASGRIILTGDTTTPANVIINNTTAATHCVTHNTSVRSYWKITGFKLTNSGSGSSDGIGMFNSFIEIGVLELGAITRYAFNVNNATVLNTGNLTFSGNTQRGVFGQGNATWNQSGALTHTFSGTPAWTTAFVYGAGPCFLGFFSTMTGAATGKRYLAELNGVIQTFGGGANYFPGDVAGTTATGGQYA